jgi:hypothetical protein
MTSLHLTGAIQLPDGSWVGGRGLRHPAPAGAAPDRGLYLGTQRLRRRHEHQLPWPHCWIDWPDFLLPRDRDYAIDQIRALHDHARAGRRVEVACAGGRRPHRHGHRMPRRSGRAPARGRRRLDPSELSPPRGGNAVAARLGGTLVTEGDPAPRSLLTAGNKLP